ncbi:MAG: hypothetical protein ACRDRL_11400 [Sciscionella sp.]
MTSPHEQPVESFSPWTVVNVVFDHLVDEGLTPVLGGANPGLAAAELLRALGIEPSVHPDNRSSADIRDHLAELRETMLGDG